MANCGEYRAGGGWERRPARTTAFHHHDSVEFIAKILFLSFWPQIRNLDQIEFPLPSWERVRERGMAIGTGEGDEGVRALVRSPNSTPSVPAPPRRWIRGGNDQLG